LMAAAKGLSLSVWEAACGIIGPLCTRLVIDRFIFSIPTNSRA
jgi:hypothetical protein